MPRVRVVAAIVPAISQRVMMLGLIVIWAALAASAGIARAQDFQALSKIADASTMNLGSSGVLHFYTAQLSSGTLPEKNAVVSALIVIHGHPRDANRTLGAGALAAKQAGREANTVVVAPLFQVAPSASGRCQFAGNPTAQQGDVLWTCSSWIDGGEADGGGPTSFQALDALITHLSGNWPQLRTITVAGFSAGAQFVQHYIGFAQPPAGVRLRYVVSDPGTWLYFDPQRPVPVIGGKPSDWTRCQDASCDFQWQPLDRGTVVNCKKANRWKYGTERLSASLGSTADQARARYASADVAYLEGGLDTGEDRGAFFKILDKSCAAETQGPYRLQRGLAYAAYDKRFVSAGHTLTVVPGCAHDVACVFPSEAARPALFPE